jgi:hypothetical protein
MGVFGLRLAVHAAGIGTEDNFAAHERGDRPPLGIRGA